MAEVDSMFGTPVHTPASAKKPQQDSLSLISTPTGPNSTTAFEIFDENVAPSNNNNNNLPAVQVRWSL
jgi:hypothetical protein